MPQPGTKDHKQEAVLPTLPNIAHAVASQPLQIPRADLPRLQEIKKRLADAKPYWCGAMPNGPFQNYAFGGREFVLHHEDVQTEPGEVTQRYKQAGKVHWLADAQVKSILGDITRKVMRGRGPGSKIQPVDHADYRPHDSDHPSGEYIYFVAVGPDFQPPKYVKGVIPKGAAPVVPRLPEAVPA